MPSLPPPGDADSLYVIDLSGFVHRAYHALPPLSNRNGEPTHAVAGTLSTLQRLLVERRPSHVAVAIDPSGPSFRAALFEGYKATRKEKPADLPVQLRRSAELAALYGFPCFAHEGFEADDVIATVVRVGQAAGLRTVVVSSDKDLLQLVTDTVSVWDPMKDIVYGPEETEAKLGVRPERVRDYLALVGDTSDNVPGVKSVGPKTALALLAEYGSLDAILEGAPTIKKPALRDKLVDHAADARLSYRLVTLADDVPITVDREALRLRAPDFDRLDGELEDLELSRARGELRRWLGKGTSTPSAAPPKAPKPAAVPATPVVMPKLTPWIVDSADALVARLSLHRGPVALEVFLERDDDPRAPLVGLVLAVGEAAAYVPVGHVYLGRPTMLTAPDLVRIVGAAREHPLVLLDAKRAAIALAPLGVELELRAGDTDVMLASYLDDPERAFHGIDGVARVALGQELTPMPSSARGSTARSALDVETISQVLAARMAAFVPAARELRARLATDEKLLSLLDDVEQPLSNVLTSLERTGVAIDAPHLESLSDLFRDRIAALELRCHEAAGEVFAVSSPRVLEGILFDKLGLPVKKRTKTARSTDQDVLEELAELHPLPSAILELRAAQKLKSTYIDALPRERDARTGRVHTRFNQAITATGRLSSSHPNLQNIPIRTEEGREIRKAFVARDGHVIVSADYSQIELRVLAHLSHDPELVSAFNDRTDVHVRTATALFGVAEADVTREQRARAKTVNFAVIYGQSEWALARNLEIEVAEAKRYIVAFFQRYAGVARFLETVVRDARESGYVTTLFHRRRPVNDITSTNRTIRWGAERIAKNTPIQGTAADIMKKAMIDVDRVLRREAPSTRMLLTVHDELVFEAPIAEVERVEALVREAMERAVPLDVPLDVDVGHGKNWDEAH